MIRVGKTLLIYTTAFSIFGLSGCSVFNDSFTHFQENNNQNNDVSIQENPKVFVEDIHLTFDSKLTQLAVNDKDIDVDYKFRINSTTEVSFYVSAKVLPNEATEKACLFERIDTTEYFTMSTEVKGDYTTATFTCAPLPAGITTTSVYFKVKPLDGNKNLVKYVKIFVQNK